MVKHLFFALALLAQLVILAWSPVEKSMIRARGTVIVLRTAPVDPYDVLSGYYMTLRYEISDPPGLEDSGVAKGATVYTTLARGEDAVWSAVGVSGGAPSDLGDDELVIKGCRVDNWRRKIVYGIERYYVPEEMHDEIEDAIRGEKERILVEVAVDVDGDASVLRLRVGDAVYEY